MAHRLAFVYMTDDFPPNQIDHINGKTDDNRWSNLRICTQSQNKANSGKHKNNTSGYKGVCWRKDNKKWTAGICHEGKRFHLGFFDDKEDAAMAYNKAAVELHGEFYHTNGI